MPPAPLLQIKNLAKRYGLTPALRGVSLDAAAGMVTALVGPSGCGKSTLLRLVAGLESADSGEVWFGGQRIDGMPVHQRDFGLMFQEYALFPHQNVAGNVAFGLRMRHMPPAAIAARVAELLALVGLAGYGQRRIDELSGGERQRVALARSLAPNPRLLMLDEPLGALDRALRERLLADLRGILRRVGVTSLYVTHDQGEAFALADWLVLLNHGQIVQQGTPEQLYRQPTSRFAAHFFGLHNLLDGQVLASNDHAHTVVLTAIGQLEIAAGSQPAAGSQVTVVIRPEAAVLASQAQTVNQVQATVIERTFGGSQTQLRLRHASGTELRFALDEPLLPAPGQPMMLSLRPTAMSVIVG